MPKLVLLLWVWFMWSAGKGLEALARHSATSDFYALASAGVSGLFFPMGITVVSLSALAAYCIWKPRPWTLRIVFVALGAGLLQNAITFGCAIRDLPGVREAYARGREARGLRVREEALDLMFTVQGAWAGALLTVLLYAAMAALAHKQRLLLSSPRGS